LLLQIMAMLWKERGYLAEGRIELYDAALNFMLDYRDRYRAIQPSLAAKDARRVLSPVSLWMQDELKKDEVDRAEMQQQMQVQLNTLNKSLLAEDFCQNLVDRAGLLLKYGDHHYVFRHKSFREYMAGVQLVKNMHRADALKNLVSHFGDDWWTEVFRFFIAHVEDADLFNRFMELLFDSSVTDALEQKQLDLLITLIEEAPQSRIDALRTKLLDPATTQNRQRYLLECLKAIGKPEALALMTEFRLSGLTKEERVVVEVKVDKLGAEYILIKGGTFIYSLTKKPETVPDLYVAKYTVTNQLYRRFISFLDAKEPEFAERVPVETYRKSLQELASGIKGFSNWLKEEPALVARFRLFYDDDKRFKKDEQPVVGVSWFAAKAWCLWLSLLEGESARYQLPDEVQWEWAAGGQRDKPDKVLKVRDYPWPKEKGKPDKTRANYNNHEGGTTPVGRYPEGATPEGLYDMAGNVWEWMENWYDEDRDWRSLRGGNYSDNADALRCSSRYYGSPRTGFYVIVGFRVIRSSHSSS
jgi:formylglycine-generating enzyme required for sulfatase activity